MNTLVKNKYKMLNALSMGRNHTILIIIDMQDRLLNAIPENEAIISNAKRLIEAFTILGLEIIYTEQNPLKLGYTTRKLNLQSPIKAYKKMDFSCIGCNDLLVHLKEREIKDILICGIESHVCVLQTVIDLINLDYQTFIPIDAIGSRNSIDHETAIKRIQSSGGILSTTETAIFELCKTASSKHFRDLSQIIKKRLPESKTQLIN